MLEMHRCLSTLIHDKLYMKDPPHINKRSVIHENYSQELKSFNNNLYFTTCLCIKCDYMSHKNNFNQQNKPPLPETN